MADALAAKQDYDAIARWRSKIKLDFRHDRRETFKWFNRSYRSYRSVQHFVKDGTHFVADPILLKKNSSVPFGALFLDAVSRRLHPPGKPSCKPTGHYLPVASPLRLKLRTAERLRRTLAKMSVFSSSGLDSLEVASLKSLPDLHEEFSKAGPGFRADRTYRPLA